MTKLASIILASLLFLPGCVVEGSSDGFEFANLTIFEEARSRKIDDILVWPVRNVGADLTVEELDRFRSGLRKRLIESRYSVLSDELALERAGAGARTAANDGNREGSVARAVSTVKELEADGVLLVWLAEFDTIDLGLDGRVKVKGDLVLLGPDGKELWKGGFRSLKRLVLPQDNMPPTVQARRALAVDRLAELLAERLPDHRN